MLISPDQVIHWLESLKGIAITVLPISAYSTITDYMIICTGTSRTHVKALADHVREEAKKAGVPILGCEGKAASEWILVDLDHIVVHVMQQTIRETYDLESLWRKDAA